MKKKSLVLVLALCVAVTAVVADEKADETKLVSGVKALDPAIVAVRPARVVEPSRAKFKIVWTPALTLKKDTPVKDQERIAAAVARYVVEFQKGVPTEDVMGGVLAFFEGEGFITYVGQVFYRVENGREPGVYVMTARNIVDEAGNVSCCDDDKLLGRIVGAKFIPSSKL